MAKVRNLDNTDFLKFKDGTPIDSSLFENDPLDSTLEIVNNETKDEKRDRFIRICGEDVLPKSLSTDT